MKATRFLTCAIAALLTIAPGLEAQTSEGRVLGTVYDSTGAVVAGAQITVTSLATNVSRHLVTTSAGEYVAPNLEPGSYTVSAESAGFKKAISTPVLLEV